QRLQPRGAIQVLRLHQVGPVIAHQIRRHLTWRPTAFLLLFLPWFHGLILLVSLRRTAAHPPTRPALAAPTSGTCPASSAGLPAAFARADRPQTRGGCTPIQTV